MIAVAKKRARRPSNAMHDAFLAMLPRIRARAEHAFRHDNPEAKEELVTAVVANAYCSFWRLVERGKADIAHATPLAVFAIKQVRSGRYTGGQLNVRDVSSRHAQLAHGIRVVRLDKFDPEDAVWREVLVEDRQAGPAEIAAARIDVGAWFQSLGPRKCRIAKLLAKGEATSTVARMCGVSPGRVSQLRDEFRRSWQQFQGEQPAAA